MRQDPNLLKPEAVAEMLGVTVFALKAWRVKRRGPRFIRMSHCSIRYRRSDVEAWIADREEGAAA